VGVLFFSPQSREATKPLALERAKANWMCSISSLHKTGTMKPWLALHARCKASSRLFPHPLRQLFSLPIVEINVSNWFSVPVEMNFGVNHHG
jgi:hypothetical protein